MISKQLISICILLIGFTCVYFAGFWIGETAAYKDLDYTGWRSAVTNEGFLEVSKILSDPKTTHDPLMTWAGNNKLVIAIMPDKEVIKVKWQFAYRI